MVATTDKKKLNPKRIEGKHIKHSPNLQRRSVTENETLYLVKSSSPFMSSFKKISKILKKFDETEVSKSKFKGGMYKEVKYITIKGMGKSMEKTLGLGLKFKDDLSYKIDVLTGSIEVLDEFKVNENSDSEDIDAEETIYKKRMVSYVEVRIWLKR